MSTPNRASISPWCKQITARHARKPRPSYRRRPLAAPPCSISIPPRKRRAAWTAGAAIQSADVVELRSARSSLIAITQLSLRVLRHHWEHSAATGVSPPSRADLAQLAGTSNTRKDVYMGFNAFLTGHPSLSYSYAPVGTFVDGRGDKCCHEIPVYRGHRLAIVEGYVLLRRFAMVWPVHDRCGAPIACADGVH
jgi:hypothetical protein